MPEIPEKKHKIPLRRWEVVGLKSGAVLELRRRVRLPEDGPEILATFGAPYLVPVGMPWWNVPARTSGNAVRETLGRTRWRCPFWGVGALLRVQERFLWPEWENTRDLVSYAADYQAPAEALAALADFREGPTAWTKAAEMPTFASRLFLRVAELRLERVQALNLDSCRAEGIGRASDRSYGHPVPMAGLGPKLWPTALEARQALWAADNGPTSWERNDWTWVARVQITQELRSSEETERARFRDVTLQDIGEIARRRALR